MISVLDDRTRLAYAELHSVEERWSASVTLRRAVELFAELGCGAPEAVMSDNHKAYTSHRFQAQLRRLGAHHIPIPPYTPRGNSKVERFQQTLDFEWAHGRLWRSSLERDKALRSFLRYYNRRRPHMELGDRPPTAVFCRSVGRTASPGHFSSVVNDPRCELHAGHLPSIGREEGLFRR